MRTPIAIAALLLLLAGCASTTPPQAPADPVALSAALNRITWGVSTSSWQQAGKTGYDAWLEQQLHPAPAVLPAAAQAQIDALTISQKPLPQLVQELEDQRRDYDKAMVDDEAKKAAQRAYQQELSRLAKEAATRSLLRDLYSPNQLQEQMTWFWMNHFNVHQGKSNLRVLVGDYEEQAIRPHALGKFRELLGATLRHPAMIRYLDNEQNAANRINENYAREIMELHTLGVDGGYTQNDVQQLARILTGVGVNLTGKMPNVRKDKQDQYLRQGLFEFNPGRHDYGDKLFLGQQVKGRGLAEVDEALDRLSRSPATARYISRKLAIYFVADEPPAQLVERMAQRFQSSDGDIAAVLRVMFTAPEFTQSLGKKFKDPVHYVVSAVRLAYDDKVILNTGPMLNWLSRMAEPLYGRQTPDGYPLTQSAWASPGQMTTRFEIAKAIGGGAAGLFKSEGAQPQEKPAFPQLANALYYQSLQQSLAPATRQALEQAASPQEWNTLLLSSPELMHR
ncbi:MULTISPECIES: DUF1800 domain-containing protein [unclassified Duganella]|uniref:DUF1800 domain-containing protein n=1 Tax=unclassified Duganella TaxID=2636909 RepID=UPI0008827CE2|nr:MULTISPECIES: DUF1800 domain-containing protein [unclassified Duganella]SDG36436.1 Uncharacterized conserved protein, DUF1800 family [Duganella sp. OV458]SDJ67016.1 Uncharacterized conserved protein, DUF1800 family [Duganella sp. OV510]